MDAVVTQSRKGRTTFLLPSRHAFVFDSRDFVCYVLYAISLLHKIKPNSRSIRVI